MSESYRLKIGATVAVEAPAGSPFPIVDPNIYHSVDWLSQNDLDTIEVHIRAPHVVDGARLKDYCAKKEIGISSIGTGLACAYEKLIMTSKDTSTRNAAVERLCRQMDLGALLECPIVLGSMRGEKGPDELFSDFEKRMLESTKALADYAEKVGTDIVIEAIDRFETSYLKTSQEVLELIDRIGSSRLKVHLDTYHMNLEEQSWDKPILICKEKLGHVHVADNTRRYPGWGLVDFESILKALKEIDYRQTLTIECYPYPAGYSAILRGADYLRKLMDKMN